MIDPLPYSLLQAEELDTCAQRIFDLVTETLPAEPSVMAILPLVTRDRGALQKALSHTRGSAFTKEVEKADGVRDDAFVAFRGFCEVALVRHSKPGFVAAGELLMQLIRAQGYGLQALGNTAQSGALNALFSSLENSAAAAAIAVIGAEELVSELKTAQKDFEKVINSRTDEQAAKDYPRLVAAKTKLGKCLKALLSVIDTLDELDEAGARPEIDELIARINDAMQSIVSPARARRTRAAEETADNDAPAPPPPTA